MLGVVEGRRGWMWLPAIVAIFVASTAAETGNSNAKASREHPITRIAFGSCNKQSEPQLAWNAINDYNPQLFIWLGDNIYGDIKRPLKLFGKERTVGPWKNVPRFVSSSQQEMESKYNRAKANPGYVRLRENARVVGTWDDHDYGLNDAGKEYEHKIRNQKLLLDFLDEPVDSPRRKQAGVYASYTFGPVGKDIKVVLLDTRYHRDPIGSDGDVLGSDQWKWLEEQLKGPATAITIIGSSIQVISNLSAATAPLIQMETWAHYPKERDRLFKLIAKSKRNGVFFISGDVHFGEISRYDCAVGYPLYDITSSGMTQAVERSLPSTLRFLFGFLAWVTPSTMRVVNPYCRYQSCLYGERNFGTIELDWNSKPVVMKVEVRDVEGFPVLGVNVSLTQLQRSGVYSPPSYHPKKFQRHCTPEVALPGIVKHRLAILVYFFLIMSCLVSIGVIIATILIIRGCLCKCKRD